MCKTATFFSDACIYIIKTSGQKVAGQHICLNFTYIWRPAGLWPGMLGVAPARNSHDQSEVS